MKVLASTICFVFAVLTASADPWGEAWANGSMVKDLDGVSATGGAVLTNGDLTAEVDEIRLRAGEISVDHIELEDKAIRIVGDGTTLKPDAGRVNPEYGGAICAVGGSVTLTNITFNGFAAEAVGGAVALQEMNGDCVIADCRFENCSAASMYGAGGAIYASAAAGLDATVSVRDCTFAECSACGGGAITTERVYPYREKAIALDIASSAFLQNGATYSGGALWVEGDVMLTNSLFEGNSAYSGGGAICAATGDDKTSVKVRTLAGTVFRGNCTQEEAPGYEANGGAILLANPGFELSVDRTAFEGNVAGYTGGAISDIGGNKVSIQTSIFSNNTVAASGLCGGAVSIEFGTCGMKNVTVRGSNKNALDFFETDAELVNCVVVDNLGADVSSTVKDGTPSLTALRSAFGSLAADPAVAVTTNMCLAGRTATDYDGGSLHLKGEPYNPVAAEGLIQDATDFDGVAYGSRQYGYSMGAFECGTESCISGKSFTLPYDGQGHTNEFASSGNLPVTWEYSANGVDSWSGAMPAFTNVGTYTTYAIAHIDGFNAITNIQTVTITKCEIQSVPEGGDPKDPTRPWARATSVECYIDDIPAGGSTNIIVEVELYEGDEAMFTFSVPEGFADLVAGTNVSCMVSCGSNYQPMTVRATVTIKKRVSPHGGCEPIEPEPVARVFQMQLNVYTTEGRAVAGIGGSQCAPGGCIVIRGKGKAMLRGYVFVCGSVCELTDYLDVFCDAYHAGAFFNNVLKAEDPADVVPCLKWSLVHAIGKNMADAETAWTFKGTVNYDPKSESPRTATYELAGAGYGQFNGEMFNDFSGCFAGTVSQTFDHTSPKTSANAACLCAPSMVVLCDSNGAWVADDEGSVAFGKWKMKYNASASKAYAAGRWNPITAITKAMAH